MDKPDMEKEVVKILSPGLLRRGDALNGIGELVEDDGYLFLTEAYKDKVAKQISDLFDGIRKDERKKRDLVWVTQLLEQEYRTDKHGNHHVVFTDKEWQALREGK